jgi:hypothetical protein
MSEEDLNDKLTEVRENVSGNLLESTLSEWTARLEWVIYHEGGHYINQH